MRITRTNRLAAMGAAAALFALTACGAPGGNAAQEKPEAQELSAWGEAKGEVDFWDTNANPVLTAKWKELIADFEDANPDITVNYLGLPNSSYLQKVNNAIVAGDVPDVMLVGNDVSTFIAQNALAVIDDPFKETLAEVIDPATVEAERKNSSEGELFKAPITLLSDVIWYRTDWIAEAGLENPTSYDEFFEVANAMTDKANGRFGFAFRGGAGAMPPMFSMAYGMAGVGEFFTEDGQATLDSPEVVAALERYVSLFDTASASADITNDYQKLVAAFGGGSAWSMHHNLGSFQDHIKALGAENVVGAQSFPDADGVATVTSPAISGLAILEKSDNKAAAWKFVEYMSTTGNSEWAEAVGQVPANLEAAQDQWVKDSQPLSEIVALSLDDSTQYLRLPTYLPEYGAILKTEMEVDFQKVLQKSMTVQDFATKYAERFEEALADYEKSSNG